MNQPVNIFWFRRDLRLDDNCGLFHALSGDLPVIPLFIFDKHILNELKRDDARVTFIHSILKDIDTKIRKQGFGLLIKHSNPEEAFKEIVEEFNVNTVYTNRDYEPYAIGRDREVENLLKKKGIKFSTFKDQVIFEKDEIVKSDGDPYTVYSPYMRRWMDNFKKIKVPDYPSEKLIEGLLKSKFDTFPGLNDLGFKKSNISVPEPAIHHYRLQHYAEKRNLPAEDATTHVGTHLRFGTISIRKLVRKADDNDKTYLKELVWREFFMQIMYHFPDVVDHNFKSKFNNLNWINDENIFKKWCAGETGYPMVDAGMRQLNETGFMHNRVRMVVASFLTKHLLTDWRWGEAYFAEKLLDYELSSNNGNWQWAASTGCDAVPYFRIFNPEEQLKKFDPDQKYIKKWIPELGTNDYPEPIVDHKEVRERALKAYKKV